MRKNKLMTVILATVLMLSLTGFTREGPEGVHNVTHIMAVEDIKEARAGLLARDLEAENRGRAASGADETLQPVHQSLVFSVKGLSDKTKQKVVKPPHQPSASDTAGGKEESTEENLTAVSGTPKVEVTPGAVSEEEAPASEVDERISQLVFCEDGVDEEFAALVRENMTLVPQEILDEFVEREWTVQIVSGLGRRFGYRSILGLTRFSQETIYIDNRMRASQTIIHEMGHFWDAYGRKTNDRVSDEDDFIAIFQAEAPAFRKFWSTSQENTATSVEYFAESFMAFILDPVDLESACPQTYSFMAGYLPA